MDKCQAGCKVFTGGEIKHHPDCVFYPESFSEMYDKLKNQKDTDMQEFAIWFRSEVIEVTGYDGYVLFSYRDVYSMDEVIKLWEESK